MLKFSGKSPLQRSPFLNHSNKFSFPLSKTSKPFLLNGKFQSFSNVKNRKSSLSPSHNIPLSVEFPGTPEVGFKEGLPFSPVRITTLPNGLRIVSQETYSQASGITVMIDCGVKYENELTKGVSHLLERMAFKGSSKRTAKELISELEVYGGHVISSSSREFMTYYVDVFRFYLPQIIDLLGDSILNPKFTEEELQEQKQIIHYDISQISLENILPESMHEVAFKGYPLAVSQLSSSQEVDLLTLKHLQEWHQHFYQPERMVVSCVGVDHESLVEMVSKHFQFKGKPTSNSYNINLQVPPSKYVGGEHLAQVDYSQFPPTKNKEVSHLLLAFEGVSASDPDMLGFATLQSLLGGGGSFSAGGPGKGMYTRLYRNILNGHSFVESAQSFHVVYSDTGLFGIHGEVDHGYITNMLEALCVELIDICFNLKDVELDRAKNQLKTSLFYSLESRSILSDDLGRQQYVYNKYYPPEYFCEKIDSISKTYLQELLKRILRSKPTLIGAGKTVQDIPSADAISQYLKDQLK